VVGGGGGGGGGWHLKFMENFAIFKCLCQLMYLYLPVIDIHGYLVLDTT